MSASTSARSARAEQSAHGEGYLSLRSLAAYSDLSVRTLRTYLTDPEKPLPHYRLHGKILVKQSEFDAWLRSFRSDRRSSLRDIVDDVMGALR